MNSKTMKTTKHNVQRLLLAVMLLGMAACTGDFADINRNPNEVTDEQLQANNYKIGTNLKTLQGLVVPTQEHMYQFLESLVGGPYAGYIGATVDTWQNKFETFNASADWRKWPFVNVISETYPAYRAIINGTDELLAELREMGVGVYATGGETADVGDLVRTIIVDSTVTCRMKRSDVINNANIRPGDVIVGLASYGQATYEKEYNGGMGSNGLTSARHDVFAKYLAEKYPESYDKAVPDELVYSGKLKLTDAVEGSPLDAGKLVLSPTRTYAPVVKKLLDALRPEIHGMVHCSGGAQTKVLHFVGDNCRVIKDNLFPVPPLFRTIKEQSDTDWAEMYKVFNMGHRLEVYLSPEHAEEVIAISKSFNIDAQVIGRIEESDKKELIIRSEFGEFKY